MSFWDAISSSLQFPGNTQRNDTPKNPLLVHPAHEVDTHATSQKVAQAEAPIIREPPTVPQEATALASPASAQENLQVQTNGVDTGSVPAKSTDNDAIPDDNSFETAQTSTSVPPAHSVQNSDTAKATSTMAPDKVNVAPLVPAAENATTTKDNSHLETARDSISVPPLLGSTEETTNFENEATLLETARNNVNVPNPLAATQEPLHVDNPKEETITSKEGSKSDDKPIPILTAHATVAQPNNSASVPNPLAATEETSREESKSDEKPSAAEQPSEAASAAAQPTSAPEASTQATPALSNASQHTPKRKKRGPGRPRSTGNSRKKTPTPKNPSPKVRKLSPAKASNEAIAALRKLKPFLSPPVPKDHLGRGRPRSNKKVSDGTNHIDGRGKDGAPLSDGIITRKRAKSIDQGDDTKKKYPMRRASLVTYDQESSEDEKEKEEHDHGSEGSKRGSKRQKRSSLTAPTAKVNSVSRTAEMVELTADDEMKYKRALKRGSTPGPASPGYKAWKDWKALRRPSLNTTIQPLQVPPLQPSRIPPRPAFHLFTPKVERNLQTLYHLLRSHLARGKVWVALESCHNMLEKAYDKADKLLPKLWKPLNKSGTSPQDYGYPIEVQAKQLREKIAGMWCLYAHIFIQISETDLFLSGTDSRLEGATRGLATLNSMEENLWDQAIAVLASCTSCAFVGNHAAITLTLSRLRLKQRQGGIPRPYNTTTNEISEQIVATAEGNEASTQHSTIAKGTAVYYDRSASSKEHWENNLKHAIHICQAGIERAAPTPHYTTKLSCAQKVACDERFGEVFLDVKSTTERVASIVSAITHGSPTNVSNNLEGSVVADSSGQASPFLNVLNLPRQLEEGLRKYKSKKEASEGSLPYLFVDRQSTRLMLMETNCLSRLEASLEPCDNETNLQLVCDPERLRRDPEKPLTDCKQVPCVDGVAWDDCLYFQSMTGRFVEQATAKESWYLQEHRLSPTAHFFITGSYSANANMEQEEIDGFASFPSDPVYINVLFPCRKCCSLLASKADLETHTAKCKMHGCRRFQDSLYAQWESLPSKRKNRSIVDNAMTGKKMKKCVDVECVCRACCGDSQVYENTEDTGDWKCWRPQAVIIPGARENATLQDNNHQDSAVLENDSRVENTSLEEESDPMNENKPREQDTAVADDDVPAKQEDAAPWKQSNDSTNEHDLVEEVPKKSREPLKEEDARKESEKNSNGRRQQKNSKSPKRRRRKPSSGRWTEREHQDFLEGLELYGKDFHKVADHICTRSIDQVRSHAGYHFRLNPHLKQQVYSKNQEEGAPPDQTNNAEDFGSSNDTNAEQAIDPQAEDFGSSNDTNAEQAIDPQEKGSDTTAAEKDDTATALPSGEQAKRDDEKPVVTRRRKSQKKRKIVSNLNGLFDDEAGGEEEEEEEEETEADIDAPEEEFVDMNPPVEAGAVLLPPVQASTPIPEPETQIASIDDNITEVSFPCRTCGQSSFSSEQARVEHEQSCKGGSGGWTVLVERWPQLGNRTGSRGNVNGAFQKPNAEGPTPRKNGSSPSGRKRGRPPTLRTGSHHIRGWWR